MHPMPHSEAQDVAKWNVCGVCGTGLTVAWGGSWGINGYVVRCGKDATHEGTERVRTLTQAYRHGASLPLPIENRLDKRFGGTRMDSVALSKLEPTEMQERIVTASAQFGFSLDKNGVVKDLTVKDIAYLGAYCRDYGLDPMLGEVCLFHGRPYVMIDGLRRKAQETGQYAGLVMRPVTDRDEKLGCGYDAQDIVFLATAKRLLPGGQVAEFQRYGAVTGEERREMSKNNPQHHRFPVLAKKPSEMAQNRAERHAVRTAFHFEWPGVVEELSVVSASDVPEGRDQELAEVKQAAEEEQPVEAEFHVVDPETGEILDESPLSAPTHDFPIDVLHEEHADAAGEPGPPASDESDPFGGEIPSYGPNEVERRKAFIAAASRWGWQRGPDDSRMQRWIAAEFRDPETEETRAWAALTAAEQDRAVHFMTLEGPNRHYEETK